MAVAILVGLLAVATATGELPSDDTTLGFLAICLIFAFVYDIATIFKKDDR